MAVCVLVTLTDFPSCLAVRSVASIQSAVEIGETDSDGRPIVTGYVILYCRLPTDNGARLLVYHSVFRHGKAIG